MRKTSIILSLQLLPFIAGAQTNLVPNPSFEIYSNCPGGPNEVFQATPWYDPTAATSDYFNQCAAVSVGVPSNFAGNENARTGVAYCGFYSWRIITSNYREYIQVKLNDTLEWGKKYHVSFYVSHAENTTYATNRIGAYFSTLPVSNTGPGLVLSYTPQIESDSVNPIISNIGWRLIEDTLYANGGELYITIGNFYTDSLTDTLYVGGPGINAAYYYIDDISVVDIGWVGINDQLINAYGVNVYPNPAEDQVTLDFKSAHQPVGDLRIAFYDAIGRKVCEKHLNKSLRSQEISVADLQEGLYLYRIADGTNINATGKLTICR